jgi:hypothetical protein
VSDNKDVYESTGLFEALGWQGGTIHQAIAQIRKMRYALKTLSGISSDTLPFSFGEKGLSELDYHKYVLQQVRETANEALKNV